MKAYSAAAKKKNRKAWNRARGVAAMYQDFQDEVTVQTVEKDDPTKTVREARARQLYKGEQDVFDPMLCFDAGRALDAGARNKDEAKTLWDLFTRFDIAHRASVYHSTGKPREPAVSRMEFMPERFEVRHDLPPIDLRSEEERHDAAMKRWRECKHLLGFLTSRERYAINDAFWQGTTLYDGGITVHGQTFVASMRTLSEVVDTVGNRR